MECFITAGVLAFLALCAGIAIGVFWAAGRPPVAERARALLRTGGVGEER